MVRKKYLCKVSAIILSATMFLATANTALGADNPNTTSENTAVLSSSETETDAETEEITEVMTEAEEEAETETVTETGPTQETETPSETIPETEKTTEAEVPPETETTPETEQPQQTESTTETDPKAEETENSSESSATEKETETTTEPGTSNNDVPETEKKDTVENVPEAEKPESADTEKKGNTPETIKGNDRREDTEKDSLPSYENSGMSLSDNLNYSPLFNLNVNCYPTARSEEVVKNIYNYLTKALKLNHAAACGVLANIHMESNFSTVAIGDGGTSLGLCQWHNGRCSNLINYCTEKNLDYLSVEGQLKFLSYELQNGYNNVYTYLCSVPNTAEGSYQAGYYWCKYYESPNDTEARSVQRGNLAQNEYYPESFVLMAVNTKTDENTTNFTDTENTSVVPNYALRLPDDLAAKDNNS